VHEEDNVKTVLADSSSSAPAARAREMGVNRYQLLRDFDFTPADEYWSETGPVWAEARRAWREKLARSDELRVATKCGDTPVYQAMFSYAEKLRGETAPTKDEIRVFVDDLLECVTGSPGSTVAESVRLGPGGRRD